LLQNPNERRPNYRPPVDTGPFFIETKSDSRVATRAVAASVARYCVGDVAGATERRPRGTEGPEQNVVAA
jgi:hypothetical protein